MLEQARDVVIIISGLMVTGAALLFTILLIQIFRKVGPTLDAARDLFVDLRSITSIFTGQVVKPLAKGAIFAAGVRKAIASLSKHSHGKGKRDGKR